MEKTIAIIEDDHTARESIKDILEIEGYKVVVAEDGANGYELISSSTPDLILCDISMPKLNGYELYEHLQQDKSLSVIPFIFLTAKAEKEDIKVGLRLGVDDYVTKPLDYEELLGTISKRLTKRDTILNEMEERFNIFYENTLAGVFVLDKDVVVFGNNKFYNIFGIAKDTASTFNFSDYVSLSHKDLFVNNVSNCYKGIDKNFFIELDLAIGGDEVKRVQVYAGISKRNGKRVIAGLLMESVSGDLLATSINTEGFDRSNKVLSNEQVQIKPDAKREGFVFIRLRGDLSIRNIHFIRDLLLPVLDSYNSFEINLVEVENIDLTFLQLLYSIKKRLDKDGKSILFNSDIPDDIKSLIELSDFYEILK